MADWEFTRIDVISMLKASQTGRSENTQINANFHMSSTSSFRGRFEVELMHHFSLDGSQRVNGEQFKHTILLFYVPKQRAVPLANVRYRDKIQ